MAKKDMKPLKVLSRKSWLVLAGVVVLCCGIAVWMISGTIDTTVSSIGVVTTYGDSTDIHIFGSGIVAYRMVNKDDYVNIGDVLLEVFDLSDTEDVSYKDIDAFLDENGDEKTIEMRSEISGYVSSIEVDEWDEYDISTTIMRICEDSEDSEKDGKTYVYAKVSGEYNEQIIPGKTRAIIIAGNHSENIYGHMTGTVVEKSMNPCTEDEILIKTGSDTATDYLLEGEAEKECYIVLIQLDLDENTGLPLFSVKQPQDDLIINEHCQVTFILRQDHPYEKIFQLGGEHD